MDKKKKEFDELILRIENRLTDVTDVKTGKYTKILVDRESVRKELRTFYDGCISDAALLVVFDVFIDKESNKNKLAYKKRCLTAAKETVKTLEAIRDDTRHVTIKSLLGLTLRKLDAEFAKLGVLSNKFQADVTALNAEIEAAKTQQATAKVQAQAAAADAADAADEDEDDDDEPKREPTDMSDQLADLGLFSSFGSGSQSSIKEKLIIYLESMKKTPTLPNTELKIDFGDEEVLGTRIEEANTFLAKFAGQGGLVKLMRTELLPKRPKLDSFESKIENKVNPGKDAIDKFRQDCLIFVKKYFEKHLYFLQKNYETFKASKVHLSQVRTFFQEFQTRATSGFSLNFLEEIENTLPNLQSFFIFLTDDDFDAERLATNSSRFEPAVPFDNTYRAKLFGKVITIRQANDEQEKPKPNFNDVKKMFLAYPKRQSEAIKNKSLYSLEKYCGKEWNKVNGAKVVTYIGPDDPKYPNGCVVTDAYNGHPLSLNKKGKKLLTPSLLPKLHDRNSYLEIRNRLNQEHIDEVAAVIVSLFFNRGRLKPIAGSVPVVPVRKRAARGAGGAGGAGGGTVLRNLTGAERFKHYIVLLIHNLQMITEKANQAVNSEHFSSILGKLAYMIYDFLTRPGNADESFERRFAIILGKLMAMEEIAITDEDSELLEQNIENLRNIREAITNLAQFVFFLPEGEYFEPVNVRKSRPQPSDAFKKLEKDYHDLCQVGELRNVLINELRGIIKLNKAELVAAKAAAAAAPAPAIAPPLPPATVAAAAAAPAAAIAPPLPPATVAAATAATVPDTATGAAATAATVPDTATGAAALLVAPPAAAADLSFNDAIMHLGIVADSAAQIDETADLKTINNKLKSELRTMLSTGSGSFNPTTNSPILEFGSVLFRSTNPNLLETKLEFLAALKLVKEAAEKEHHGSSVAKVIDSVYSNIWEVYVKDAPGALAAARDKLAAPAADVAAEVERTKAALAAAKAGDGASANAEHAYNSALAAYKVAAASMKRTRDAADVLAKDARDKLASAADDAVLVAGKVRRERRDRRAASISLMASTPMSSANKTPISASERSAASMTPTRVANSSRLNADRFRAALSTIDQVFEAEEEKEESPIKVFSNELLLIPDRELLVAKDKFLVALDLAAAAAAVAADAAEVVAADDAEAAAKVAATTARMIADELKSVAKEARDAANEAAPAAANPIASPSTPMRVSRSRVSPEPTVPAASNHELVILKLASLYSTYHSYFKDFCRTLAMTDNASFDDAQLRVANSVLATELLTLTFPPDLKTDSQLNRLIRKYDLITVFNTFKRKVGTLKDLIRVIRETDGFSELIRKARILMKSSDDVSMTELIDAVQVLTESDQYNSNDDVVVLTARVADAEGDYLDCVGKFLELDGDEKLNIKQKKYETLLTIDRLELEQAVAVAGRGSAQGAEGTKTSEPPFTPRALPVGEFDARELLRDVLDLSTPKEMLDEYNNLLVLEAAELGVPLGEIKSTPFTPAHFKPGTPHPTIMKLKDARNAVDAEIEETTVNAETAETAETKIQISEAAICSETFERAYAVENLQRKIRLKARLNVAAFYGEAANADIVLPIFVEVERHNGESTDAYLTRKLTAKMSELKDVSTIFPNTLGTTPIVGITERFRAGVTSAATGIASAFRRLFSREAALRPVENQMSSTQRPDLHVDELPRSPLAYNAMDGSKLSFSPETPEPSVTTIDPNVTLRHVTKLPDSPIEGGAKNPMTLSEGDLVNQLYDLYIYFLENDVEDENRAKIKDILFYHGIYCPSEQKDAIDLNVLVEQVKRSDENDDFKCEKCCHTVFGMGFHELFYSLSNGLPAIPFGCHPYLLDDPMNRNTFLYIFGVSRYLHVAFPKSARMELYFMTLCSAFGRDYWICKRPDYDIQADVIHPMFFTAFYELSGDPEYYEVNLTPDDFLESNGKKFAARKRDKMAKIMKDIETRKAEIEEKVKQTRFKEAQSKLKELTRDVQKEIRRSKRTQEKSKLAGIDIEQEIEFMNEDSEVTESKKQVHCFKLHLFETISRKNEAIQKFIDNAKTMIECATDKDDVTEKIKEIIGSIPELSDYLPKETQSELAAPKPMQPLPTTLPEPTLDPTSKLDNLVKKTDDLFGVTVSEFEKKVGVSPKEIEDGIGLEQFSNNLDIKKENFYKRAEEIKESLGLTPLDEPRGITDGDNRIALTAGKTLRKRVIRNKTRTKLNRKSRRNKYK